MRISIDMDRERFRSLCQEVLPLVNGMMDAVSRNGYRAKSDLIMGADGDFYFSVYDTGWSMARTDGGPVKICHKYSEEIRLKDQPRERMAYGGVQENLVEISFVYAGLKAGHGELGCIDSATWKQKFVDWANEFEEKYPDPDHWAEDDYLECIGAFATEKICEYANIGGQEVRREDCI